MDIGGALAFLIANEANAADCPLARLGRALTATGAPTVREAAIIHLKEATLQAEDADAQLEQAKIARDKLKAELQRVEAIAADAETARHRALETVRLCKSIVSSNFVDGVVTVANRGAANGDLQAGGASTMRHPATNAVNLAMDVQAPEMGHGANHDAPVAHHSAEPSMAPHSGAALGAPTAYRSAPAVHSSAAAAVLMALQSDVEVKESALLPLLAACDAAAQGDSDAAFDADMSTWTQLVVTLWSHLAHARAPVQLAEASILKATLRRGHVEHDTGLPLLATVALEHGAPMALAKLIHSINDDVKAEALEVLTCLAAFPEARGALLADQSLAAAVVKIVETSNSEPVLERALTALWTLAGHESGAALIHELGGIPAVLSLMFTDSIAVLDNVVMALGLLTRNVRCKATMRECGGLEKLVACLLHPSPIIRVKAAGSIWNCAADPDNRVVLLKIGAVPLLVEQLGTPEIQENVGGALWNLALEPEGKAALLEFGAIPAMVQLLSSPDSAVVENATGTLWNCSSTLENRAAMRKFGALPPIVSLLRSPVDTIRENAAGALRNLVINDQNKVAAREAGAIDLIVDIIDTARDTFLEKLVSCLLVLSVQPENKHAIRLANGFKKIVDLLAARGLSVVNKEKLIGILRNCSAEAGNRVPLLELGVVSIIAQVARDLGALDRPPRTSTQLREHIAALLWNLSRDDKVGPGRDGALEVLVALLADPHDAVVEQAAAAISSLASNAPENRTRLFNMNAVLALGHLVDHAAVNHRPVVLQHTLHAVKHSTASHEDCQKQLLQVPGIVQRVLQIVLSPPVPNNLEGASRCTEDIVREGVFVLRNIASTPAGAELMRQADAVPLLQRVADNAKTETIRFASAVVLQALTKRPYGGAPP